MTAPNYCQTDPTPLSAAWTLQSNMQHITTAATYIKLNTFLYCTDANTQTATSDPLLLLLATFVA